MIEISPEFLRALLTSLAAIEDEVERESMLSIIIKTLGIEP